MGTYPTAPVDELLILSEYATCYCGMLCRRSPLLGSCWCWLVGCIYCWLGLGYPPAPVVLPPKWPTGWCPQHSEGSWLFAFGSCWTGSEWRLKQKLQMNRWDSDKEGGQETKSRISEYWCTRHASTSNHSINALWTFDIRHDLPC